MTDHLLLPRWLTAAREIMECLAAMSPAFRQELIRKLIIQLQKNLDRELGNDTCHPVQIQVAIISTKTGPNPRSTVPN